MDLYQQNLQFQAAEKICKTLNQKGFEAYLAGGCVRDFLLGRVPNDFDVATSASPDEVEKLFSRTLAIGKSFGVMVVLEGEEQIEVATFRKDGTYRDGRRPDSVEFCEAEEDAMRRDFTVNGLFYDLKSRKVLDYVQGQSDLKARQIRAIGEPDLRFSEDHLRLLRALRFATQLDFEIESATWQSVQKNAGLIADVSGERIQDELGKILIQPRVEKGLDLLFQSGVLKFLTGVHELSLVRPELVFARQENNPEDRWFRFFSWISKMSPGSASLPFFETLCDRWKFSRDLKQKSMKSLGWVLQDRVFSKYSLGELLALSYEPEHWRGLREASQSLLGGLEKEKFDQFVQRRQQLGPIRPAAWVNAADLMPTLKGEELGRALKACFWKQLDGSAKSKAELLKEWGL